MLARLRKSVSLATASETPADKPSTSVPTSASAAPAPRTDDDKRAQLQSAIAASNAPTTDASNVDFLSLRTLDRYLIARDGDLSKATKQLDATLHWRAAFPVAPLSASTGAGSREDTTPLGHTLRTQAATGKMAVLPGADGRGRATILMRTGLENSTDNRGKMSYLVYTLERASRLADVAGGGKYLVLNDYTLGSVSMSNLPSAAVMHETTAILQGHYPERLACMVFVGAPRVFHGLFRMIRPLIDVETREKLVFVDRPDQVAAIVGLDRMALPKFYGGNVDWEFDVDRYFNEDTHLVRAQ